MCVCSRPHRAPPHFTDLPGTVRRPMQCPMEREGVYFQHNAVPLIILSDEVITLSGKLKLFPQNVALIFKVLGGNIFSVRALS